MIDPQANTLLVDGQTLAWSKLVLACGANPVRLPLAGDAVDQVLSVNNRLDYALFREALIGKRSVVLLGAGLIGCEFANDLVGHGFTVTVVDCAPHPLGRLLPVEGGTALQKRLEQAGVRFRFGRSIARVDRSAASLKLTLDDASVLDADMVLSAVGLTSRTELATAAGLAVQRGIVTDQMLQTSHPDIYALGDVVQIDGWVLPFVLPLMAQARALAATLSGQPTPVHYPAFPVTVKTPACPTVVCPPASGIDGQWLNKTLPDGWRGEYRSTGGELHGFALMGETAIRDRFLLAKQIKDWLPVPHLSTTECLPA
jgi:rubredoxin-NAD+ reductase